MYRPTAVRNRTSAPVYTSARPAAIHAAQRPAAATGPRPTWGSEYLPLVDGCPSLPRREAVRAAIEKMVAEVQAYVPGYRLKQAVQFEVIGDNAPLRIPGVAEAATGLKVSVFLEVEGAAPAVLSTIGRAATDKK